MESKGRRHSEPTRCGSEREEESKHQNKNVARRGAQEKDRLDQIQEMERKNMKREQQRLRQEMRAKQQLTPSVDSYLNQQMGRRTAMRQNEYDQIAKRSDGQRRAILEPQYFMQDDEVDSDEEEVEGKQDAS